jgi:glycosyltransferase involved in cell wall biosynthesis
MIVRKGLMEYFRFMPFAPNIAETIRGVDVVVMPSLWEACPLQPMETLVCGTPLICTNCIGLREVISDTPARVVPISDAQALTDAIYSEINFSSKDDFIAFREVAKNRYDVMKTKEEIVDLYNKFF